MSGLTFHRLRGSAYEVGHGLGRLGAPAVHDYLVATEAWSQIMRRKADRRLTLMRDLVFEHCADHAEELRGLADGLGLAFDDVFAWNCRGDLWAMAPEGCTTVQIPGVLRRVIAHDEDGLPGFAGRCFMVRIERDDRPAILSFAYPGSIPGHTFAMTAGGLVQAVNNVRIAEAAGGLPRMVLGRAILDAATLDEAVARLRSLPRAGGFHMTLAQAGDARLLSVEFTDRAVSVVEIARPAVHANHLVHAASEARRQVVTASSAARQARGDRLIAVPGADPLSILWDDADPVLPLLRQAPDDPDDENLMASALFTLEPGRVAFEVFATPRQPPTLRFDLSLEPLSA